MEDMLNYATITFSLEICLPYRNKKERQKPILALIICLCEASALDCMHVDAVSFLAIYTKYTVAHILHRRE